MENNCDVCKHCGADRGLHQYKTLQCPVGGVEGSIDKPLEWMEQRFEKKADNKQEALDALLSIQTETTTLEGHSDPGAITDCFNLVREYIQST